MAVTVSRISPDELKRQMDVGREFTIIDARQPDSYNASPVKLRGAIRIPPDEIENRYVDVPRNRPIVVY